MRASSAPHAASSSNGAILYATFRGLDLYLRDQLTVPRLPAIPIVLMGVVAPWSVGILLRISGSPGRQQATEGYWLNGGADLPACCGNTPRGAWLT